MPWAGKRMKQPTERLPRSNFVEHHLGECKYCRDEYDSPGPVKMMRDSSLQLLPDCCNCLLCGQRYYIAYEDLEAFIGFHPSLESIPDYGKTRFRSIDDDWKPSD